MMQNNKEQNICIDEVKCPNDHQVNKGVFEYINLCEMISDYDRADIPGYQKFIDLGKFIRHKAWENGIPLAGAFELTPLCNLDCSMCYVHLNSSQCNVRDLLEPSVWKRFIDQAVEEGMMFSQLTGGECLSYYGFNEVYLYLRSKGVNTSVLTNGTLIDNDRIEFFKKNRPPYIQISLYGSNEDEYEQVTGHRYFHKVLNAICRLKEAGIPLRIAITVSRPMLPYIYNIVKLIDELDLPYNVNYDLVPPYVQTGRISQDICLNVDEIIRARKEVRSARGQKSIKNEFIQLPAPRPETKVRNPNKGMPCSAGRSAFSINWQGDLMPCNTIETVKFSLLTSSFMSAWETIKSWSMNHNAVYGCSDCAYNSVCYRCPLMHELYTGEEGKVDHLYCNMIWKCVIEGVIELPENEFGSSFE